MIMGNVFHYYSTFHYFKSILNALSVASNILFNDGSGFGNAFMH